MFYACTIPGNCLMIYYKKKRMTPRLLRYIKQQPRRFIKGSIWLHLEETKEPSAFKATTCIITYPQK